ncbi:MAG: hypothetical protein IKC79_01420 [Clostridia bacterium]|nr:hypothetical protein [Clostridia bacterium]
MRKTTVIISLSVLCAFLTIMLITSVLAATYVNLSLHGNIQYTATEIGARMFVATDVARGGGQY